MALSNIFREPRREITESAVGIGVFALLYAAPGTVFAMWLGPYIAGGDCGITCSAILAGLVIWPVFLTATVLSSAAVLFVTHEIGEELCDSLERRGVHLRPRNRPW